MKTILIVLITVMGFLSWAQDSTVVYDSTLARELGADDYGMKSYFLVMLSTGDSIIGDKAIVQKHFEGHLKNIGRLADERKLIVAGPLNSNPKGYRGIFIFDMDDKDQLEKALMTDPAIKAGLLNYTIYNWYGSAALPTYLDIHEKIQKTSF